MTDMALTPFIKYGMTFFSGGFAGALFTWGITCYKNRVQRMKCFYMEDEVQSMIPVKVDGVDYNNMYLKIFDIENTTNLDIKNFSVRFVFDPEASIIDYVSHTKEGKSKSGISIHATKKNECSLSVNNFTRGDKIKVVLRIGNVSDNRYFITEYNSLSFNIVCKDKRKSKKKTDSCFSKDLS